MSSRGRHRESRAVSRFLFLQREPHLNRHLPVPDFAVLDVAAGLGDFEPAHVADGFGGLGQGGFHGVLDAVGGRAHQFDLFVNVIAHEFQLKPVKLAGKWEFCRNNDSPFRPYLRISRANFSSARFPGRIWKRKNTGLHRIAQENTLDFNRRFPCVVGL